MKLEVAILHHEHYPDHARGVVEQKLQHLDRFFSRTEGIRALLERQHDQHRVELVAHAPRGVVKVVEGRAGTLNAALDQAVERMARVLSRHKDRQAHGGRRRAAPES